MTDAADLITRHNQPNDDAFSRWMIEYIGVASVPGSSFYRNPEDGKTQVRFCFCKKEETMIDAELRLEKLLIG